MIFPVLLISNLESGILITPCPTHLQSQKKPGPEIEGFCVLWMVQNKKRFSDRTGHFHAVSRDSSEGLALEFLKLLRQLKLACS
jgi:hypothetical protein